MRVVKKEGLDYYNAQDIGLDEDTFSILYGGGEAEIPVEVQKKYPHLFDVIDYNESIKKPKTAKIKGE